MELILTVQLTITSVTMYKKNNILFLVECTTVFEGSQTILMLISDCKKEFLLLERFVFTKKK